MKDRNRPSMVRIVGSVGGVVPWQELTLHFPCTSATSWDNYAGAANGPQPCDPRDGMAKLVYEFVKANGKHTASGRFDLECPWSEEHTTGIQGTAYFAPSTLNGGRGGFKCQHAHCAYRRIDDFSTWVYNFCTKELA